MSDEIIKSGNTSYARYEELLLRRDEVKKQAFQYDREYTRVFGDLIIKVFQMKLECIRKKKTIEYCRIFANRGESVDTKALQEYLAKELAEYKDKLKSMIDENEAAKKSKKITELELLKIKRIYHRLVKKIHPDISPITQANEDLYDLWNRLVIAYECNDLKEMEETEVLINSILEKQGISAPDISIPDIDDKVARLEEEIEKITSTDPYQYKYILDDPEAVSQKNKDFERELREYEGYAAQLDEMLKELLEEGVTLTWEMT